PFTQCESDISGDWDISCADVLYNVLFNQNTSNCANATVQADLAVTGKLSFVPGDPMNLGAGDYTYNISETGTLSYAMPAACTTALNDCTDMNTTVTDLDGGMTGFTCWGDVTARCFCRAEFNGTPQLQTGTFSVTGGNLNTSGALTGMADVYCRTG